jgi:hypothetical protein
LADARRACRPASTRIGDKDVLIQRRKTDQHDDVVDHADHQNAERRADDRAASTAEWDAAQDDAGDRLQRIPCASQWVD